MNGTEDTYRMNPADQIPRDALIYDLAIVLAGALHPSAQIGPAPRLAARRMQDVLGIPDGARVSDVRARLRAVLADDAAPVAEAERRATQAMPVSSPPE